MRDGDNVADALYSVHTAWKGEEGFRLCSSASTDHQILSDD